MPQKKEQVLLFVIVIFFAVFNIYHSTSSGPKTENLVLTEDKQSEQAIANPTSTKKVSVKIEEEIIEAEEVVSPIIIPPKETPITPPPTISTPTEPAPKAPEEIIESETLPKTKEGLTKTQQSIILTTHNEARNKLDLPPLNWSQSVAESAQSWADTLGEAGCSMTHSKSKYGENLYYAWTTGRLVLDPETAVDRWVAEDKYYNYSKNTCAKDQQCGHYTQVVWKDTREVGCGFSVCSTQSKNTQIWVCQYSPAGNINGNRPY